MASTAAPAYKVPPRKVVAVEHPLIIKNLENGLKTFGRNNPFERLIDTRDPSNCVPLYIRHNDPMCVPILSHNTPTNNVLLQITVPKRINKKRKREASWLSETEAGTNPLTESDGSQLQKDNPWKLLKSLKDNVGNYTIKTVAEITNTHRYRGVSDFHHSTSNTEFVPRFQETVLTGNLDKLKQFKLDPTKGWKSNNEFIPPPRLSNHAVPFNWEWQQNPEIYSSIDAHTVNTVLISRTRPQIVRLQELKHDVTTIPDTGPEIQPEDPNLQNAIILMKEAFEERPIWTRRAITNRLNGYPSSILRQAYPYVGYQFRGGPWHDALIRFGVDPRSHPRYRIFQTVFFKANAVDDLGTDTVWNQIPQNPATPNFTSHLFGDKDLAFDGRLWQVCDITDPLLSLLARNTPYPTACDSKSDGWFQNGSLAKVRAIMKTKLIASGLGKSVQDEDFEATLAQPDFVPGKKTSRYIPIPVPDLHLTDVEVEAMKKAGLMNAKSVQAMTVQAISAQAMSVQAMAKKPRETTKERVMRRMALGLYEADDTPGVPDARAVETGNQMSGMGTVDQGTPSPSSSMAVPEEIFSQGQWDFQEDVDGLDEDDSDEEDEDDDEPEDESDSEDEDDGN